MEIVAIDQWNNETSKKIDIVVKTKKTKNKFVEKLNASKIRKKDNPNKIALIIGIENYSDSPKASYANLDAKYFYEYVKRSFGIREENIKLLVDIFRVSVYAAYTHSSSVGSRLFFHLQKI